VSATLSTASAAEHPHPPQSLTFPDFELPAGQHATVPPESRGLARDEVRLLVARLSGVDHARARDLPRFLAPGDVVVLNTSATIPAAIDARLETRTRGVRSWRQLRNRTRPVVLHLAGPHPDGDGTVVAELRRPDGAGPVREVEVGDRVRVADDAVLEVVTGYPEPARRRGSRLWRFTVDVGQHHRDLDAVLAAHGRPITYDHLAERPPLAAYRTPFMLEAGSAEMPSAGRPLTNEVLTGLVARGIHVAPVVLHTGVSSLELGEAPPPERYRVPAATARLVTATQRHGGRVIAVGTTVARALETAAAPDGSVRPDEGWTDLELGPDRPARVVTGLLTGWHEPRASHLRLLQAVAGVPLLARAYDAALARGYLWHEFGDSCLLLP